MLYAGLGFWPGGFSVTYACAQTALLSHRGVVLCAALGLPLEESAESMPARKLTMHAFKQHISL